MDARRADRWSADKLAVRSGARASPLFSTTLIEAAGHRFHNSFVLATPAGEVADVIRRSRSVWLEARWYEGRSGPHVIETALGRIGVGICYENYLAAPLRALAAARVDLVLQPTAAATSPATWPTGQRGAAAFDAMLARLTADHARALGVPVVMTNLCGDYAVAGLDTRFPSLSSIVEPDGEMRARLRGEEGVIATDVLLGGARGDGPEVSRARYWVAPMPWYAPAWPVTQHLCAMAIGSTANGGARPDRRARREAAIETARARGYASLPIGARSSSHVCPLLNAKHLRTGPPPVRVPAKAGTQPYLLAGNKHLHGLDDRKPRLICGCLATHGPKR